jgi:hypothetical protein
MLGRTTLKRHAALVDRMAEARGVDLEEQILRGNLRISELEDAVLRCTGCDNPDGCERWLAQVEQDGTTVAQTPPQCRNADVFSALDKH